MGSFRSFPPPPPPLSPSAKAPSGRRLDVELRGGRGNLRDGSNHREDAYGGAIENRASAAGGLREGFTRQRPAALFNRVVEVLNPLGLAYVHVVEGDTGGARDNVAFDYAALRARFVGAWMVTNGDRRGGERAPFIANSDPAERLSQDAR